MASGKVSSRRVEGVWGISQRPGKGSCPHAVFELQMTFYDHHLNKYTSLSGFIFKHGDSEAAIESDYFKSPHCVACISLKKMN